MSASANYSFATPPVLTKPLSSFLLIRTYTASPVSARKMATATVEFDVPTSTNTVSVRVINTGGSVTLPASMIVPTIKGMENLTEIPSFSFLVEHPSGRKVLFDLGIRKDWENGPAGLVNLIKEMGWTVRSQTGVHEVLEQHGVQRTQIEAVIWSHWHWDHTGDVSVFPHRTTLILGPGTLSDLGASYPANPDGFVLESDFHGREVKEISFQGLKAGRFDAADYFGDGSFYLLDAPGHTVGHINALARVTADPPSFIFIGGDTCHHAGEFRPSAYLPLPEAIHPDPLSEDPRTESCPGSVFEHLLRDGDRNKAFYDLVREAPWTANPGESERSLQKMQEADALPEVFVIIAHDKSLLGRIPFFPESIDNFRGESWARDSHWAFLSDFHRALC